MNKNKIYIVNSMCLTILSCASSWAFVAAQVLKTQLLNYIAHAILPPHHSKPCLIRWIHSHYYCMWCTGILFYRKCFHFYRYIVYLQKIWAFHIFLFSVFIRFKIIYLLDFSLLKYMVPKYKQQRNFHFEMEQMFFSGTPLNILLLFCTMYLRKMS